MKLGTVESLWAREFDYFKGSGKKEMMWKRLVVMVELKLLMLSIDQMISWIGFYLTVYGSIACAWGRSFV